MSIDEDTRRAPERPSGAVRPRAQAVRQFVRSRRTPRWVQRCGAWWGRHQETAVRRLPAAVLAVGLVVNGVVLVVHSTGIWFWADDWDLLFMRGTIPHENQGILEPHNNHWLTAHILVYRLLFDLFGIGSYTPFAVTAILFHLATALLVSVVVRRAGAGRWVATFTGLTVAFYGLGTNAQIPSSSLNHVGALVCGLVAALIVARSPQFGLRQTVWCGLVLILALMFGLTALALVVLVVTFAFLQHGLRKAALVLVLPAVVFAIWWLAFGRNSGVNSISPKFDLIGNLPSVPRYIWTGITGTLGDGSGLSGAGPLLAGLILVALVAPARPDATPPPMLVKLAWASVAAALFQLLVVSIARFDFGADQVGSSHYAYINLVLLTPAIALVAVRLGLWSPAPRAALGVLAAVVFLAYALNGLTYVRDWQKNWQFVSGNSADLAFGIKAAIQDHETPLAYENPDGFNKGLAPRYIGTPRIMTALGNRKADPLGRLRAETTFFSAVGTKDHGLAQPPADLTAYGMTTLKNKPGCQVVTAVSPSPTLRLDTGAGGNELVVWSTSTQVSIHLERDGVSGPERDFTVKVGAVHVATTAKHADLYAEFNGTGRFTVCRG